ncbi:sensor histidine kinase [Maribacter arcticus]|uniref:sensor histidine kinase n=1 Tax=Maribacter arcticus TaxID=561365 RepID=UPI0030028692
MRSRSLAMHKPDELGEVVGIVLEKLQELGITNDGEALLWERKEGSRDWIIWLASDQNFSTVKFFCPYLGVAYDSYLWDQLEKGLHFFAHTFSYEEKNEYYDWAFVNSDWKYLPDERKTWMLEQESQSLSVAWTEKSGITIPSYANKILTEQEGEILLRFSKVFEQAYTRFLDLQKAEAQAREAQIEGALERVRSRSLAMHNSEELLAVIEVVSEQLHLLDLKFDTVSFGKNYQESDFKFWLTSSGQPKPVLIQVPFFDSRVLKSVIEAQKKEIDFIADVFTKKENRAWSAHMIQHSALKNFPEQVKDFILNSPGFARSSFLMQHIDLYVGNYRAMPFTDEENAIFKRFAQVFAQAYTRFLDLQKAEDQAKEALIEAALERVRSRTMAMQHSTELNDTSALLFQQIQMLGVPPWSCGFNIWEKEDTVFTSYMGSPDGGILKGYKIPLTEEAAFIHFKESRDRGDKLFIDVLEGNALETHYRYFQTLPGIKEIFEKRAQAGYPIPTFQINHLANFSHGNLMFITYEHCPEAHDIFIRFAKVFEQTYTRFLDLQKAEAQAREAQIEAALEKVRSRSLAMHNSNEMQEVANTIHKQFQALGLELDIVGMVGEIGPKKDYDVWVGGSKFSEPLRILYNESTQVQRDYNKFIEKKSGIFSRTYVGKVKEEYINHLLAYGEHPPKLKAIMVKSKALTTSMTISKSSGIQIARYNEKPYSHEENQILIRFGKVFAQAYIRFLDLQKAEAQAREAQIEAALEKVRSRSMGMQKSTELLEVILVVSEQLQALGFRFSTASFLNNNLEDDYSFWVAPYGLPEPVRFILPYKDIPMIRKLRNAQKKKLSFFTDISSIKEHQQWFQHLLDYSKENTYTKEIIDYQMSKGLARSVAIHNNIMLAIANNKSQPYSESENKVIARFGQVFEQSYTRFLDLERAEAQAREAQIEAALEKVRSRSMAMQKSDELKAVVSEVFEKLKGLNIAMDAACIYTFTEGSKDRTEWVANPELLSAATACHVPFINATMYTEFMDAWEQGQDFFIRLWTEDEKNAYWKLLFEHSDYKNYSDEVKKIVFDSPGWGVSGGISKNSATFLVSYSEKYFSEEENEIVKRFGKVFEQAYTRFLDLKKAEAQAREAQIEAALEKVRSRSLEMSESSEMQNVANEILKQVRAVGLKIDALAMSGVIDNDSDYDVWVGGANSKKPLRIPYNNETQVQREFNKAIKERPEFFAKTYTGKVMKDYFKALMGTGNSFNPEIVAFMKTCNGFTTTLSFMKNSGIQLIRYSEEAFSKEDNTVIVRFGKVFEQTYIRFLDLQKAEEQTILAQQNLIKLQAQKQRAEEALSELQQTQTQLIQSEKMASLGELTAGIAHEIQNPLNFVNNFSEVSKELLEEMQEEIENGDFEEVKAIMEDVIQNLEKINHHGKRADGIVKGMLQHSRSSSGTKEPTDINALADEYLRLAYHGLRVKDKSFNATLETDFDESIGTINVLPQDMGRVILNLITNAFYASNERKQASKDEAFKPTVSVSTKKLKGTIEISVKDNGKGIPAAIVDKIFQPFFTTKPTGQGTGLGLSMSYDIITKGHSGKLNVETKEGEGSKFSIHLPINN